MSAIRLALFGQPVSHSPSPRVHRAFAAQFGLEVDYRLIEASPEEFSSGLQAFRADGGTGCNITLPLKHLACELADEVSPRARLAAAANTLWWSTGDRCHADNTDGEGLVRDIEINFGIPIEGSEVLLLGAGGAAAGVLGPLLERRPARLVLVNRTLDRARALARRHADPGKVRFLALDEIDRCGAADICIEATSMGRSDDPPKLPPEVFAAAKLCYSLNYGAAARPMERVALLAGVPFRDGLGMLVEQAALSFEIWTGHRPKTGPVLAGIARLRD